MSPRGRPTLDLTAYSLAALYIYALFTGQGMNLIRSLAERAAELRRPAGVETAAAARPVARALAIPRLPRRGGSIHNW